MKYLKIPALALNFFLIFCALSLVAHAEVKSGLARLDAEQSSMKDIMWGQVQIKLSLSQGVPYRVYTQAKPDRVVLEFNKAFLEGITKSGMNQSDSIDTVDLAVSKVGWNQVIFHINQPFKVFSAEMKIPIDATNAVLELVLAPVTQEEFDTSAEQGFSKHAPVATQVSVPSGKDAKSQKLRVVIDPGHGGIDPGAQFQEVQEADLMLSLARQLKETLLRNNDFEVSLTRVDDSFVSLEERVRLANSAQADIFVSLHADAVTEGVARGATVYTLSEEATDAASAALAARHNRDQVISGIDLTGAEDAVTDVLIDLARLENAPRSKELALSVVSGLENSLGQVNSKPYRKAGFSVLKAADIPSILIEAGFMSTDLDLQNLQNEAWQKRFAEGVRAGIMDWMIKDQIQQALRRK